ncbi:hypothetical protein JCM9140_811 [Halalkalibacter wakoensis JCM 9140]|uniref:Uncharacterized protein n=1 Tax=Halalkalibacter wakoensis JCM 9140 TaxID=1236970 RepID=W4PYP3_9BACI|nr:hypothetical protein [Halalkalibacter wakoensis]GAE24852.1 hypothetical protein JCM9140_811 [Halalkalibacter wakoensis JCM 9140]
MFTNNADEVRQMIKKAKTDEEQAKVATNIVNHAVSEMDPQRRQANQSYNRR